MYSLLALAVAALTACAIALPPSVVREPADDPNENGIKLEPPIHKTFRDFILPRILKPMYTANGRLVRIPYPRPQMPSSDWLNKEIDRINRMQDRVPQPVQYKTELPRWIAHEPYKRMKLEPVGSYGTRSAVSPLFEYPLLVSKTLMAADTIPRKHAKVLHKTMKPRASDQEVKKKEQQVEKNFFALTPLDEGYFEPTEKDNASHNPTTKVLEGPHEGGGHEESEELGPRRQIRQNPISRTKTLVNEDLDKLRVGVGSDAEDKPQYFHVFGSEFATGTIYVIGIAAGIVTAIILGILGFVFGWYALSKRAKAAADVDYPAYGVTGPTMDTSGDRKLAHSAQMYHYQHQKQQIIAMERNNMEQRNGSVSDPESEEENEEGDYTVYECPGFATTGDMEVKNPLFNEEPTPATPGNIEVVMPQPKE